MKITSVRVAERRRSRFCRSRWSFGVCALLLATLFQFSGHIALAGDALDRPITLDIPANTPLDEALIQWGVKTGVALMINTPTIEHQTTHGVSGTMPARNALSVILRDSGLTYTAHGGRIRVVPATTLVRSAQRDEQAESKLETSSSDTETKPLSDSTVQNNSELGATRIQQEARRNQLEVVTVTAQKREQRIQDVPMSISAFSGEDLHNVNIETTKDLTLVTPGLVISGYSYVGVPSIRGINTELFGIALDPSTAVYVDGVYSPLFSAVLSDMADVRQVEVLKGPQVVLYGRNATAGAINYVSNDPGNELGGDVKVAYGNFHLVRTSAALNVPLVPGTLLFRAFVMSAKDNGYAENITNSSDHPGQQDLSVGRFTLKYLPLDNLDITLRGYFSNDDGSEFAYYKARDPVAWGSVYVLPDPFQYSSDQPASLPRDDTGANLTIDWDLGWAKLTSISAFADDRVGPVNYSVDGTEIPYINSGVMGKPWLGQSEASKQSSEEVYLVGSLYKLDWLIGASYLHEHGKSYGAVEVLGTPYFNAGTIKTDAYAGYGQLTYALTDRLHITGGVRYSDETKDAGRPPPGVYVTPNVPLVQSMASWDAWTYSGTVKYTLNTNNMVYATVATGFKSGGFDPTNDLSGALAPEKIISYEVGAKTGWFDDRLNLDISAFKYRYTNLQINTFIPPDTQTFANAGAAVGKGVEVEAHARPVAGLEINGGLSVLDAKFTQYNTVIGLTPASYAGNILPDAPRLTYNVGASYSHPVADVGTLTLRTDYYYSSRRFFFSSNDPLLTQKAYGLLGGRLSFAPVKANWEISLYAKNITNELVRSYVFNLGASASTVIDVFDPPRTYGVEFVHHF